MFLPKIKFKVMSLEDNIDIIKWTYFDNEFHDNTILCFPELGNLDSNLSNDEIYKRIEEVITDDYNKKVDLLTNESNRYSLLWEKYNDKYFEMLSNYLGINWPNDKVEIEASVGLIPVFPRYLDNYSFDIGVGLNDDKAIEICAHETLHFLWFEKWKSIHPETPREEFDTPYLPWQYSEMVTDSVLNNKPFTDLFSFKEKGYDYFYDFEDNGTKVMDNLREIYSRNIPVEEKINLGFEYINKALSKDKHVL